MFVRSARPHENFGRVLFTFICVLLLAGCPSPPKTPPRVTPLVGSRSTYMPGPARSADDPAPESVNLAGEPTFSPAQDRHDPVLPEETLQIPTGLLALNDWAQLCGFYDVRVVPDANPYTVDLEGPSGVLTLIMGQRFAKWNGINI